MPRARLQDVAARAGVSVKTVSNVVLDKPQVGSDLRARVQEAIAELGYRPHAVARQLRSGRTGLLALALPEIDIPYFAELGRHVVDAARHNGYTVMVEQTGGSLDVERALFDARDVGLFEGVLFNPWSMTAEELAERARDAPLVLIGEGALPDGVDHVGIDDHAAAAEATEHLLRGGRRRVAFCGVQPERQTRTSTVRRDGWRAALATADCPAPEALELPVPDFSYASGAAAVRAALTAGTAFDALVCASDLLAIGALSALRDAGVAVPEQVAVVGFDDIASAAYATPALTSVRQDRHGIATAAVDLLLERVDGASGPGHRVVVPHQLVLRRSSAAAPGAAGPPSVPAPAGPPLQLEE